MALTFARPLDPFARILVFAPAIGSVPPHFHYRFCVTEPVLPPQARLPRLKKCSIDLEQKLGVIFSRHIFLIARIKPLRERTSW